ncbi:MAG: helix-turn-helix domain-containing protein [Pirellulales bacterium]|nr:helix-turn-helix domain-containing protein [Pirellulales bacterium]
MASYLTFEERQVLYRWNKTKTPKSEIARWLGRDR